MISRGTSVDCGYRVYGWLGSGMGAMLEVEAVVRISEREGFGMRV